MKNISCNEFFNYISGKLQESRSGSTLSKRMSSTLQSRFHSGVQPSRGSTVTHTHSDQDQHPQRQGKTPSTRVLIPASDLIDDLADSIETEAFIHQARKNMTQGAPSASSQILKTIEKVNFKESKKRLKPSQQDHEGYYNTEGTDDQSAFAHDFKMRKVNNYEPGGQNPFFNRFQHHFGSQPGGSEFGQ